MGKQAEAADATLQDSMQIQRGNGTGLPSIPWPLELGLLLFTGKWGRGQDSSRTLPPSRAELPEAPCY